jgi:4'-phosphopantetheinyl transferase
VELNWPVPSEFPELSGVALHIWSVRWNNVCARLPEMEAVLTDDEQARAGRFIRDEPRRLFLATRSALRAILGCYLDLPPADVRILTNAGGKPYLADGDVEFNVAHSGERALVAVARGFAVGVDLEQVRPVDEAREIAARNFHPDEHAAICAADVAEQYAVFLRYWTRKEAVLKAIGAGLGYPLDAFEVLPDHERARWVELPARSAVPRTRCWLANVDPCPGYLAAVATAREPNAVRRFTFAPPTWPR